MTRKTQKQQAAENLHRRAGQYERHGKASIAQLLRDAAKRLLGIKDETNTWEEPENPGGAWDDLNKRTGKK